MPAPSRSRAGCWRDSAPADGAAGRRRPPSALSEVAASPPSRA
jgi:hypothetical protein